ncbi:NHE domain-containing protein 1 [Intoshia linei]|uniref:NHE domain-containing protein 1 n=1 Tax=Intoshia linei TaxID=1819745 RepID=A0A177B4L5_9BILA|nr:NHE domain-containing protein 1 [Intoshia linei]
MSLDENWLLRLHQIKKSVFRRIKQNYIVEIFLCTIFLYISCCSLFHYQIYTRNPIFDLFVIYIVSFIVGKIAQKINLPALFGVMIAALILRNIPIKNSYKFGSDINEYFKSICRINLIYRNISLCVILMKAGIGLKTKTLKKMSLLVFRLAFIPCIVETITVMLFSHYLLNLTWLWGLILGSVLAAVSPAVIVPSILNLKNKKYGTNRGIPTLIIAACSIDDVLAITIFSVVITLTFRKDNSIFAWIRGPLEAIIGIIVGLIFGFLISKLPLISSTKSNHVNKIKITLLLLTGTAIMLLSLITEFTGAGTLGVLSFSLIVYNRWIKNLNSNDEAEFTKFFEIIWIFFETLLFVTISIEVDIEKINYNDIEWIILTLFLGLFFRMIATTLSLLYSNLKKKEIAFVTLSWIPKATVQAAIGSIALDKAKLAENDIFIQFGQIILTSSILAILITAPVGSILIALTAKKLLTKPESEIYNRPLHHIPDVTYILCMLSWEERSMNFGDIDSELLNTDHAELSKSEDKRQDMFSSLDKLIEYTKTKKNAIRFA